MMGLTNNQRFWIASLVIGGYMLFGGLAGLVGVQEGGTIYVISVLSTMGPLVGWTVKGLFDGPRDAAIDNLASGPIETKVINDPDEEVPVTEAHK